VFDTAHLTVYANDTIYYNYLIEPAAKDSIFEIYTVEDLYEFARIVNSGNRYLSARVMNDIVVNENVLDAEGNPTSDTFRVWTPIKNDYSGVFDGNGHVISGLYIPNGRDQWSMFISIHGGTIKNLGVEDSYYSNSQGRSGGICGQTWTNSVITNCYFKGVIKCGGSEVGGITSACHNGSVVSNCFSMAKLSGASAIHGICPVVSKATVENCYYLEDDFSSEIVYADSFSVLPMTPDQFADGEVCYKLNKGVTDGTQVFFQNLDEPREDTLRAIDLHPVFDTAHLTVYANDTIYYNYLNSAVENLLDESGAVVYVEDYTIVVSGAKGYLYLSDMNGNVLFATQKREETSCVRIPVSKAGVYVVVVDGASCKVLVR
jgi:hypothetical protein